MEPKIFWSYCQYSVEVLCGEDSGSCQLSIFILLPNIQYFPVSISQHSTGQLNSAQWGLGDHFRKYKYFNSQAILYCHHNTVSLESNHQYSTNAYHITYAFYTSRNKTLHDLFLRKMFKIPPKNINQNPTPI